MYNPPFAPRAHQKEALDSLESRPMRPSDLDVHAWLMEYGTGKTKVMLDEFGLREDAGEVNDLLVVAPKGVYMNWHDTEMPKHLPPDLRDRMVTACWKSGSRAARQKIDEMIRMPRDRGFARALLVNVEALSSVDDAYDACVRFLETGRAMMCVDESTTIKGQSQRSDAVRELGKHAVARRIATGMVAPRSPLDLYAQFDFLDWRIIGSRNFWAFKARYAIMRRVVMGNRRRPVNMVVGYRNVEELQEKIAPYSFRKLKKECLDLPEKEYMTRTVELTPEQQKLYDEMKHFATAELENGQFVDGSLMITRIMRLHQITCGYAVSEEGELVPVKSNRLRALLEVLGEHSGKAVIWTHQDPSIRAISAALEKEFGEGCVARFWGGNVNTREDEEKRFLHDDRCRFMVSTQSAGGRGRTWVVASLVVYYSNSFDLEHRMNSEDRTHRDGLRWPVTYVDMRSPGTVDDRVITCLRKKLDITTQLSGEGYREWLA